jgi:hypothetical protein
MKPIFIERLLQPRYALNYIRRKFWRLVAIMRPGTNAHRHWLNTLYGTHGWRCVNGKLRYFEQ